jgi:hypothetical protein
MASHPESSTAPLRRIATMAMHLPLALLTAAVLSGCGTGEGFDEPDPVLQADTGGALFAPQSTVPGGTTGTAGVIAGASERPAPASAVPVVSGKTR